MGGVAILSMVAFSKLSRGHLGVITLLLQWSVSIVTSGLLLPIGHAIGVNNHWWFLAATDHVVGGNSHCGFLLSVYSLAIDRCQ